MRGRLAVGPTDLRRFAQIRAIIAKHEAAKAPAAIVGVIDGPQPKSATDCGFCDLPLVNGDELEAGYHLSTEDGVSCYEQMKG